MAVGKSCLLLQFTDHKFRHQHELTIGVEFGGKTIEVKNKNVKIQIWDTAGQEAFRSITRTYYKSSTCAFIVYDISDKKTFDNIITWLNECRDMCYKDILICLIGNKCDLEGKRAVSYEEGKELANSIGCEYYEGSAMSGENIDFVMNEIAKLSYNEWKKTAHSIIGWNKQLNQDLHSLGK